ncbi:MAG: ABC transporter substrate-binding protein [Limnochordia bacterium]|nr:ABC transporter substrate-binding protein [Limnochordia bacterium]MDD2629021.1 ABC transporter substrate-binding protein [Limnochordia bacterium]MDD4518279.1 ABC transporter substrate-binding protein [Limnochordia bacterium]
MRTILAAICCALLLLQPFADGEVAGASIGRYGGSLTFGVVGTPRTFNYFMAEDHTSLLILDFVYDGLVEYDYRTGELVPALAASWDFNQEGTVWTFHLRQDVLWHDGEPFTADDVLFTFGLIFDETLPFLYRESFYIDGSPFAYTKLDDYTIRLTLPRPFAPLLSALTMKIMPRHKLAQPWMQGEFTRTWGIDCSLSDVVGTGPFQLVQYQRGREVVLLRNPRYWKKDAKGNLLPYLTRLVIRTKSDLAQLYQDLGAGRLDVFEIHPGTDSALLKQIPPGYTLYDAGLGFSSNILVLNQDPNTLEEMKHRVFADQAFRQAIAHAIDQERIIQEVYGGLAVRQRAFVSPASRFYHETAVPIYEKDLLAAREILRLAGFSWDEADLLRSPDGWSVELSLCSNADNPERVRMADLIAEDLRRIGVSVEHHPVNANVFVRKLSCGDWDCVLLGLESTMEPHDGWDIWHSSGYFHLWQPMQLRPSTPWEGEIDRLFEVGATTMDRRKRYQAYAEAQRIAAEQLPMIFLPTASRMYLVRDKLQNVEAVGPKGVLGEITTLWIENP